MEKKDKMDELIAKYLFDKLSEKEENELNKWIDENPGNKKLFDKSKEVIGFMENASSDFKPDENKSWEILKLKIESQEHEKTAQNTDDIKVIPLHLKLLRIAAVIFVLFGFYFSLKYAVNGLIVKEGETNYELAENVNDRRVELTTSDSVDVVYLPDNSLVYLNKNSKLIYDEGFHKGKRIVYLEGESFFKVAHNPETPFIVYTKKSRTQVLGTSFNIKAYKDNPFTELSVYTGKVGFIKVGDVNVGDLNLVRNDRVVLENSTGDMVSDKMNDEKYIAWIKGYSSIRKLVKEVVAEDEIGNMLEDKMDPKISALQYESKNAAEFLNNISNWENSLLWDGRLKHATKVEGQIYNSAVHATYDNLKLKATFYDFNNKVLGQQRFKVGGSLAPGKIITYEKELKFFGDSVNRVNITLESANLEEVN